MSARDLTAKFHEFRACRRAFAQLEQWTEANVVDGLLAPSYCDDDVELGADCFAPTLPNWVERINAMEARCDAVECELRRMATLQRQRLLVMFNVSQVEAVDQELQDAAGIVVESMRAAEALLSTPYEGVGDIWPDVLRESDAARSSRFNASQYLAKRLQVHAADHVRAA